jgi:hypothetical protein
MTKTKCARCLCALCLSRMIMSCMAARFATVAALSKLAKRTKQAKHHGLSRTSLFNQARHRLFCVVELGLRYALASSWSTTVIRNTLCRRWRFHFQSYRGALSHGHTFWRNERERPSLSMAVVVAWRQQRHKIALRNHLQPALIPRSLTRCATL